MPHRSALASAALAAPVWFWVFVVGLGALQLALWAVAISMRGRLRRLRRNMRRSRRALRRD